MLPKEGPTELKLSLVSDDGPHIWTLTLPEGLEPYEQLVPIKIQTPHATGQIEASLNAEGNLGVNEQAVQERLDALLPQVIMDVHSRFPQYLADYEQDELEKRADEERRQTYKLQQQQKQAAQRAVLNAAIPAGWEDAASQFQTRATSKIKQSGGPFDKRRPAIVHLLAVAGESWRLREPIPRNPQPRSRHFHSNRSVAMPGASYDLQVGPRELSVRLERADEGNPDRVRMKATWDITDSIKVTLHWKDLSNGKGELEVSFTGDPEHFSGLTARKSNKAKTNRHGVIEAKDLPPAIRAELALVQNGLIQQLQALYFSGETLKSRATQQALEEVAQVDIPALSNEVPQAAQAIEPEQTPEMGV